MFDLTQELKLESLKEMGQYTAFVAQMQEMDALTFSNTINYNPEIWHKYMMYLLTENSKLTKASKKHDSVSWVSRWGNKLAEHWSDNIEIYAPVTVFLVVVGGFVGMLYLLLHLLFLYDTKPGHLLSEARGRDCSFINSEFKCGDSSGLEPRLEDFEDLTHNQKEAYLFEIRRVGKD